MSISKIFLDMLLFSSTTVVVRQRVSERAVHLVAPKTVTECQNQRPAKP
jgi:hypothetical protein